MVRPYTFTRYADHQVAPKEAVNDLQAAIEDIDATGTTGGGSALTVQDESTPLATAASTLNFVGAGVVASGVGATKTITISGGTTVTVGPGWLVVAGQGVHATVKARADYICTGTADQTIMQSALDALPDNNGTLSSYTGETTGAGGVLFVGLFNLTGGLVCHRDHVTIAGLYGSTIFSVSAGFPNSTAVLSVNRDAQLRPCYFVQVRDLRILGNGVGTGVIGYDLMLTRSRVERLAASGLTGDGMVTRGNASPRWAGNSNEYTAILINGCTGWGWNMRDFSEDNRATSCEFFSNTAGGIRINGSAWLFSHGFNWGNLGPGMLITGASARIHLSQYKFEQNNGGLYIGEAGSGSFPSEVIATGLEFGSNSWTTINTTDDVQIAGAGGAPTGVHLIGCYWDNPYSGQQARYGINYINGDVVRVFGGRMTTSFGTGQINFGSATGANFAVRNLDNFTPQGPLTVTVGASPLTITAGNTPEIIYVRGGAVSSITKGGNQIAGATEAAVALDPNEAIVVTYSVAPTIWRDRR